MFTIFYIISFSAITGTKATLRKKYNLEGNLIVEPIVFSDDHGCFLETYRKIKYRELIFKLIRRLADERLLPLIARALKAGVLVDAKIIEYLRGWVSYFGIQEFRVIFRAYDGWIPSRLS